MPETQFSLLADEPCGESLPVATVVDTVEYARFAPLLVIQPQDPPATRKPKPAVYPLDHAIPEYVAALERQKWFDRRVKVDRGGLPLISAWQPIHPEAKAPKPVELDLEDITAFISKPTARIAGRDRPIQLNATNVAELTTYGRTLVTDETGDAPPVVVRASHVAPPAAIPGAAEVLVDVGSFLADPTIRVGDRPLRVALTASNVRELLAGGATTIDLPSPPGRARARMSSESIRLVPAPTGAVGVSASAMTIGVVGGGTGAGEIMTVEERRERNPPLSLEPAPAILPTPAFEFALYLPYRQEWTLLGYSRGELVNSIPLAPEELTTIEVFTWDRTKREREETVGEEREFTYEVRASRKETAECVNEIQRTNNWKLTAGGQIGLPPIKGITISGQIGSETSTVIQQTNSTSLTTINEVTASAAAKLRFTRQTKVSETVETGVETRVTRRIQNPNRCHTLTYDFFQVLAAYRVVTRSRPERMRLAVLLPDPMTMPINREWVLMHEGIIAKALLDRELERGLEAARYLAARDEWCLRHCDEGCKCPEAPKPAPTLPKDAGTTSPAAGASGTEVAKVQVEQAITRVLTAIATLRTADFKPLERAFDTAAPDSVFQTAVLEYRRWLYRTFGLGWFNPAFWGACTSYERDAAGDRSPERLERLLGAAESGWLETLLRGAFLVSLWTWMVPVLSAQLWLTVGIVNGVRFTPQFGVDDAGLGTALSQARDAVNRYKNAQDVEVVTAGGRAPPGPPAAPAEIPPVPEPAEPFPWDDAVDHIVALRTLLAHLDANRSHYKSAIWQAMDPTDRAARLGLYGYLGNLVENEILGFVGDKVAVPFQDWQFEGLHDAMERISKRLTAGEQPVENDLTLPTPGIAIGSRLDDCDVCEPFVTGHRELDLAEKRQKVRQERFEGDRRQRRLQASPPDLRPFDATVRDESPP